MTESRIELTDRLRRSGQWPEAAAWKDGKREELRAGGMRRAEAKAEAWRLVAAKYPDPEPEPADVQPPEATTEEANRAPTFEELNAWLDGAVDYEVNKWLSQHRGTLPRNAKKALIESVVAFCLVMEGRHWPGPRYAQDDEWLWLCDPPPSLVSVTSE